MTISRITTTMLQLGHGGICSAHRLMEAAWSGDSIGLNRRWADSFISFIYRQPDCQRACLGADQFIPINTFLSTSYYQQNQPQPAAVAQT